MHTPLFVHMEFSSAFFFVFHRTSTSLKLANEKDSASMSYNKHEATASIISSEIRCFYNISECSCALACPVPIAIGKLRAGLDFFGSFCIKWLLRNFFFDFSVLMLATP